MNHDQDTSTASRRAPRVIALGGGGGGVGRSTTAVELARVLVRQGERVLLVDAHERTPTLWTRLDLPGPWPSPSPEGHLSDRVWPGDRAPALLTLADPLASLRPHATSAWFDEVRAWPYDTILLDLGGAPTAPALHLWLLSDIRLLCTAVEAHHLQATQAWCRGVIAQLVPKGGKLQQSVRAVARAWTPFELPPDTPAEEERALVERLHEARSWLLLLRTREAAERQLLRLTALGLGVLTGLRPIPLMALDEDDRRWFHMRQLNHQQLLASKAGPGAQIEELARTLGELPALLDNERAAPPWRMDEAADILGLSPQVSPQHARSAYRHLWEGLRRDSPVSAQLLPAALRASLLDAVEGCDRQSRMWKTEPLAAVAPSATLELKALNPGRQLREARVATGAGQRELAIKTQMSDRMLDAIERMDVHSLPRDAMLRAYLRALCAALPLEEPGFIERYLRELNERRAPETPS